MLKDKHKDKILKVANRTPYLEKLSFTKERKKYIPTDKNRHNLLVADRPSKKY